MSSSVSDASISITSDTSTTSSKTTSSAADLSSYQLSTGFPTTTGASNIIVTGDLHNSMNLSSAASIVTSSNLCLAVVTAGTNVNTSGTITVTSTAGSGGLVNTSTAIPCILITPPKKSNVGVQRQYRLLKKSPLKTSPVKVSPILRQQFRRKLKCKATSPRKLKFILPKKIRERSKQRCLRAKPAPVSTSIDSNITTLTVSSSTPSDQPSVYNSTLVTSSVGPALSNDDHPIQKTSQENESLHQRSEIGNEYEDANKLQEERLVAFLKASSTIALHRGTDKKPHGGSKRSRLNKQQKALQERITALSFTPDLASQEEALVLNYIIKVKNALSSKDPKTFDDFVSLFNNFSFKDDSLENLFATVCDHLQGFDELKQEFVMFLTPSQAAQFAKYSEYSTFMRMREFVDELKYNTARQPHNFQKVFKTLQTLISRPQVSQEEFIETLAPLLRFQPQLIESLNQLLPSNHPAKSLDEDFEEINLDNDFEDSEQVDDFEMINLVDNDIKALTENCSCSCHTSINVMNTHNNQTGQQTKIEHCVSCGIKFIDGRVYLQYGKTLRPAKVSFLAEKKEHSTTDIYSSSQLCQGKVENKIMRRFNKEFFYDKNCRSSKQNKKLRVSITDSTDGGSEKVKKSRTPKRKFSKISK